LLTKFFSYIYTPLIDNMKDRKMLASILFFFLSFVSMAQGDTPPPPPPGLPIDGGIFFVFLLALSFGAYKAYKISQKLA